MMLSSVPAVTTRISSQGETTTGKLMLICICCLCLGSALWAQSNSATRGVLGYLDPNTGPLYI